MNLDFILYPTTNLHSCFVRTLVDVLAQILDSSQSNSDLNIKCQWANCSLSAFDKENSIEFLLDLLHYIYNYCYGYAPLFPMVFMLLIN